MGSSRQCYKASSGLIPKVSEKEDASRTPGGGMKELWSHMEQTRETSQRQVKMEEGNRRWPMIHEELRA